MKSADAIAINVKRLFVVILTVKIVGQFAGWTLVRYFGWPDAWNWMLGFVMPVFLMLIYIWLGATKRHSEVSDEKFADSCYYLGFIFTISSIIIALLDLPSLEGRLTEIAARFGVAMFTTVLGLGVRVVMVNFRPDAQDSMRTVEDALVHSANMFRSRMEDVVVKLGYFQNRVDEVSKSTFHLVQKLLEDAARANGDRTAQFFEQLSNEASVQHKEMALELKTLSNRIAATVVGYSEHIDRQMHAIEENLAEHASSLRSQLERVTIPQDFFQAQLMPAVEGLKGETQKAKRAAAEFAIVLQNETGNLTDSIKRLNSAAKQTALSLQSIEALPLWQASIADSVVEQSATNKELAVRMDELRTTVNGIAGDVRMRLERLIEILESVSTEQRRNSPNALIEEVPRSGQGAHDSASATRAQFADDDQNA